jgi:hypothetical protein
MWWVLPAIGAAAGFLGAQIGGAADRDALAAQQRAQQQAAEMEARRLREQALERGRTAAVGLQAQGIEGTTVEDVSNKPLEEAQKDIMAAMQGLSIRAAGERSALESQISANVWMSTLRGLTGGLKWLK